jgi:hypothetical protein
MTAGGGDDQAWPTVLIFHLTVTRSQANTTPEDMDGWLLSLALSPYLFLTP